MANEEQLAILGKGLATWNNWRNKNIKSLVDLSYAHLRGADLKGASLWGVDLERSNLVDSNLSKADLRAAKLKGSHLNKANLSGTNLAEADLSRAELLDSFLQQTILEKSIFSETRLGSTTLRNLDLSQAIGLSDVIHRAPSSISMDTISLSRGKIPEVFLRGCGLSDWEIESAKLYNPELSNDEIDGILYRIHDLRATQALQISPLFISYSHGDSLFVDKIENYLNKKGIRFWRDVHDMKSGRIEAQIDRAIRQNPTVLLILSENSLKSDWVEHEVRTARELEKEMRRDVLCPVALDDSWKNSPWPKRIMEQVMEYNILDFSNWKDDSKFGSTFNKLIDGLELFYKC